jgi:hypothetical protein
VKDNKEKKDSKYITCNASICLFSVKPVRTVYCMLMPGAGKGEERDYES